jgi:hypothetical protein
MPTSKCRILRTSTPSELHMFRLLISFTLGFILCEVQGWGCGDIPKIVGCQLPRHPPRNMLLSLGMRRGPHIGVLCYTFCLSYCYHELNSCESQSDVPKGHSLMMHHRFCVSARPMFLGTYLLVLLISCGFGVCGLLSKKRENCTLG